MNRQFYLSLIVSFLLTGLGIFCVMNAGVGNNFTMRNIYDAAPENEQSIVCLYKEIGGSEKHCKWFLSRLGKDGQPIFSRAIEKDAENFEFSQCMTDESGYTYVLMEECTAEDSDLPPKQYVAVYDRDFRKIKNIFMTQPDPSADKGSLQYAPKIRWRMQYLQNLNGDILAVQVKNLETMVLHIYNSTTGNEWSYTYNFPEKIYAEEVIADGRGGLYLTDMHSRLFHILADGLVRQIDFNKFTMPYRMSVDDKNNLYFTDIHNFTFVRYSNDNPESDVMYHTDTDLGNSVKFQNVRGLHYEKGVFIGLSEPKNRELGQRFYFLKNTSGGSTEISVEKKPEENSFMDGIKKYGYDVLLFIASILSVLWAKLWARRIILKVLAVVPVLIICISFLFTYTSGNFFYALCDNYIKQQFHIIADYIASDIHPQELKAVAGIKQNISDADYQESMNKINQTNLKAIYDTPKTSAQPISNWLINWFMRSNQDLIYYAVYYVQDGQPYLLEDLSSAYRSNRVGTAMKYMLGVEEYKKFLNEAQTPSEGFTTTKVDVNGVWISSIAAIYDEQGNSVGYVETGMSEGNFEAILELLQRLVGISAGVFTWVIFLTVLAITYFTLRPLAALQKGVEALGAGNLDTVVDIRSRDEFEEIGNAFNKMAWQIKLHMEEILNYSKACARFIPFGFFQLIGKERIEDIVLGDQIVQDVIVLSVDAFMPERSDDKSGLLSLNNLFTIMAREINKSGGIIEGYFGTGLRAIYPDKADEALDAALCILNAIEVYNTQDNAAKVFVQATLASGNTMIGIIGSEERMAAVLMAENVAQAAALQKIGGKYRVPLLLTRPVCQKIDRSILYDLRTAGEMENFIETGCSEEFLQCLNAESMEFRKLRVHTKSLFEVGVAAFAAGDYLRARKLFIDCLRVDESDELAKAYVFLCDRKAGNSTDTAKK